jgi:hypothetical protein
MSMTNDKWNVVEDVELKITQKHIQKQNYMWKKKH